MDASKPSNRLNVVLSSTLMAWVLFSVIFAPVSFAFINETNVTVDSNISTEESVQNSTEESKLPDVNPDALYEPEQPISSAKLWIILLIMLLFLGIIVYIPLHHLKRGKKLYKY